MAITPEEATTNAALDAIGALADSGVLRFATSGGTARVTVSLQNPAFDAATGGEADVAGLPLSGTISNSGNVTQVLLLTSGIALVATASVGTSGEDVNGTTIDPQTGQLFTLDAFKLRLTDADTVLETNARNAACAAACGLLDAGASAGYIEVCDGATVLGTVTLDDPAMGAPSVGVATANNLPKEDTASGTGTVDNFKARDSNGVLRWSGSAGDVGTEDCVLDNANVVSGQTLRIIAFTMDWPA